MQMLDIRFPLGGEQTSISSFAKNTFFPAFVILAVIGSGVGAGWLLAKSGGVSSVLGLQVSRAPGAQVALSGKEVGINDTKTFRDSAQGILKKGGIDSEGTHHLERAGGESQNVYLTSSVLDLDEFTDQKVEVWGETIGAKKAGWLMDVGKIKVVE